MKWRVCSSRHCWNEWTTTITTTTTTTTRGSSVALRFQSVYCVFHSCLSCCVKWPTMSHGVRRESPPALCACLYSKRSKVTRRSRRKKHQDGQSVIKAAVHVEHHILTGLKLLPLPPTFASSSSSSSSAPPASGTSAQIVFCKKTKNKTEKNWMKGWNAAACSLATSFHPLAMWSRSAAQQPLEGSVSPVHSAARFSTGRWLSVRNLNGKLRQKHFYFCVNVSCIIFLRQNWHLKNWCHYFMQFSWVFSTKYFCYHNTPNKNINNNVSDCIYFFLKKYLVYSK